MSSTCEAGAMPRQPRPIPGVEIRERARQDGSVRWEYRVRWTDPTSGRRLVEICNTPEEALDFKAHLRLLKRRGTLGELDRGRDPLTVFTQRWLEEWAAINLTERTLRSYASIFNNHLAPRIGHLQLRHITPKVIDELAGELTDAGIGAPTIRRGLGMLQAIFREAVRWGEVPSNPVKAVKKPSAPRQRPVIPFTVAQVELVIAHLAQHDGPDAAMLAELIAYSGARPQDALAISWARFGRSTLLYAEKNVDGVIAPGAKTGGDKSRSVSLLGTLRRDLLAFRAAQGNPADGVQIIRRGDGQPWREHDYKNWQRRKGRGRVKTDGSRAGTPGPFARAAAAAGRPDAVPYDLRHTYASLRLAEQRLSLKEIADEMGHTVQQLSDTYAHVIADLAGAGPVDPDELIVAARGGRSIDWQTRRAS